MRIILPYLPNDYHTVPCNYTVQDFPVSLWKQNPLTNNLLPTVVLFSRKKCTPPRRISACHFQEEVDSPKECLCLPNDILSSHRLVGSICLWKAVFFVELYSSSNWIVQMRSCYLAPISLKVCDSARLCLQKMHSFPRNGFVDAAAKSRTRTAESKIRLQTLLMSNDRVSMRTIIKIAMQRKIWE